MHGYRENNGQNRPKADNHFITPTEGQQLRRPNISTDELTKQFANSVNMGSNSTNHNSIGGAGDRMPQSSTSFKSQLSPFAVEFVPRMITNPMPTPVPREDPEDFIAVTYLKEFIDLITIKPNKYDNQITFLTDTINAYIDEDTDVMLMLVNTIVDQSITEPQFRYNGVRLCIHFMENLLTINDDMNFKKQLFQRCQRETSSTRLNTLLNSSEQCQKYVRGLTLFIGDLYSRSMAPELADYVPQLLLLLLSKPHKENLKCVCQVLKLCGALLEEHYKQTNGQELNKVIEEMKGTLGNDDISVYIKELVTNIIEMQKRGWTANMPSAAPIHNPYLNMNFVEQNAPQNNYHEEDNYSDFEENYQTRYDFGQCGDEDNTEICDAFDEFLKHSGQN
ncbi:polyadenylate-binding protein-interacting protein 1-like [Oppia nitens]|uniref:polyadenylate-binding protein-interacting protein 1-like n=1 Tax=Oppia nitens TaxID=1686743 RepID=UPI0023DB3060|nr:polyadenylate-binding protein-interacting protein 1-like [Oppia nitens]